MVDRCFAWRVLAKKGHEVECRVAEVGNAKNTNAVHKSAHQRSGILSGYVLKVSIYTSSDQSLETTYIHEAI